MREEGFLLIQQMVTKITTSLSLQHSAVIWDSTMLPRISKFWQIISLSMHCKLGKDCYGLLIQEGKQKHHNVNGLPKLTPPTSAVWHQQCSQEKGKTWE